MLITCLDPCLIGCDHALAEADKLIQSLVDCPASLDPELAAVRMRIGALRHEVERLRGMPIMPMRRETRPDRIDLTAIGSPWTPPGEVQFGGDQVSGI